jgi:hypothetical protein
VAYDEFARAVHRGLSSLAFAPLDNPAVAPARIRIMHAQRTEGPTVLPAKGAALVKVSREFHLLGPTGQPFSFSEASKTNGWPVKPSETSAPRSFRQSVALCWKD